MSPEQLLQECETLSHDGRMRRMVELGRQASSDTSIQQTLDQLATGAVYERCLAIQACYGSRDSRRAVQALFDASRGVRSVALRLVPHICSDEELLSALPQMKLDIRIALIYKLQHLGRQGVIDRYLEGVVERDEPDLAELLRSGSPELVARHMGRVVDKLDLVGWRRLAKYHARLVWEEMQKRIAASEASDPFLLSQINNVLPALTESAPDLALELVKSAQGLFALAGLSLRQLVEKRPNQVADLVLQQDGNVRVNFTEVAPRIETVKLRELFTRHPDTIWTACFKHLKPEQRLVLYEACGRGWRNSDGILDYEIVSNLPAEQRLAEARRHMELPVLLTRPQERIRYAAFLPWDEARAQLDASLKSPDAALRGAVLTALISATRYQRERRGEALQLVLARRNEQDPVRQQMLLALASLPRGSWRVEHLEPLREIIQQALDAKDLSPGSGAALERLVSQRFAFYPAWAASQLGLIYEKGGSVRVYNLEAYLSDRDIPHIATKLEPLFQAWQGQERDQALVSLATALGRRLRVFPQLSERLIAILDYTRANYLAESVLHLLGEHCPERLREVVPALLEKDKSVIVLDGVHSWLHRYRQDLLTPFLGQQAYEGRFTTGRTRYVLPLDNGFYRWTPTQQEMYAQTLLSIPHEPKRATYELIATIRRLAAMPALNPAPLIRLANDENLVIRDTALLALGTLDAGQGIPTLLEALNDQRARVAIYALRQALLTMPADEALLLLRNAPLTVVTVAKEVVRLIGDLSGEVAYQELLSIEGRELHRDVRVALLRALWSHPERARTWEIFTRAAQSSDPAIARGVVHIPTDGISSQARERLAGLLAILLIHPNAEVRMETLQRCQDHPVSDPAHQLFSALLTCLTSVLPDESNLAAQVIFTLYTGKQAELVGQAMHNILSNRRTLLSACGALIARLGSNRSQLVETTRAVLEVLRQDPYTIGLRVEIILLGLPWEEIVPEILNLREQIHPDALEQAKGAILRAARRPDANLSELEQILASHSDQHLRRLALSALLARTKGPDGWSDEARNRLERYQQDPAPLVAEAALYVFPA